MLKYFHLLGYKYVHLLPIYCKVKIFHVIIFILEGCRRKFFNGELFPNYGKYVHTTRSHDFMLLATSGDNYVYVAIIHFAKLMKSLCCTNVSLHYSYIAWYMSHPFANWAKLVSVVLFCQKYHVT